MDANRYKSVAINMPTYNQLKILAKKGFDIEVSMSRAVQEAVKEMIKNKKVS